MHEYDLISALRDAHNETIGALKQIRKVQLMHSAFMGGISGAILGVLTILYSTMKH